MPSTKSKREKPARQRKTLHDFFRSTPVERETAQKATGSVARSSTRASFQQEIIEIDSGSEDAVEFVETKTCKRRRLSPKSTEECSDLRILHSSDKAKSFSPGNPLNSDHDTILVNSQSHPRKAPKSPSQDHISFGVPILLLEASLDVEQQRTSAFGKPHLHEIEGSGTVSSFVPAVASRSKVSMSTKEFVDIDLTVDDWETGDDEGGDSEGDGPSKGELSVDVNMPGPSTRKTEASLDDWEVDASSIDDFSIPFLDAVPEVQTKLSEGLPQAEHSPLHFPPPVFGPPVLLSCDGKRPNNDKGASSNAFSVLMSSFKENEVWREASVAEHKTGFPLKSNGGRRKAPFYKVLQGMPIAVDAFKYGAIPEVAAYFLTHAHSDHYTNLSSAWKHGPIYCSQGTANLIVHMLSVDRKWVHPLPMDTPTLIPNSGGVTVTLIEANHCPGSCLFFFEGPQTVNAGDSNFKSSFVGSSKTFRYLHCGDFRASPRHIHHPSVKGKIIDHVYLDTTYLDPKYTFPPQPLVISACAELARRLVRGQPTQEMKATMLSWVSTSELKGKDKEDSKPLVIVGTYSIGKERIVKAIAHALDSKIYCDARKTAILKCQEDPELNALLTSNPRDAIVHLVPLSTIATDHLKVYLDRFSGTYNKVIGFRPTGWTFSQAAGTNQLPSIESILADSSIHNYTYSDLKVSKQSTTTMQLYPVPYSEHSSFYELTCFAMSFSWVKMIATVNVGSESSRAKMAKWVAKWERERKKHGRDTIVPHHHPDYW